jgi:hypothetical protein
VKPLVDLIDAKTGNVVVAAGTKVTPRMAKKLAEEFLKTVRGELGADETAVRQNLEAELFAVLPTPPPAKPAEQAS